jgi:putative transposase
MAKKKRHSRVEIATKLAQANGLAAQGKLQSEIARTLGVSVMTLHRWRKAPPGPQPACEPGQPSQTRGGGDRIAELQLENSRLRRLVTDLLLEKIKLEEADQRQPFFGVTGRNGHKWSGILSENSIGPLFTSCSHVSAKLSSSKSARWRHELFGTIAQRLNLKHELHHTGAKLRILGFEPLK